jgi:hypothetical protein
MTIPTGFRFTGSGSMVGIDSSGTNSLLETFVHWPQNLDLQGH